MSHVRQQIREAFGTACTSLTTTGTNVFQSRIYPLEKAKLPGLCIYSLTETSDDFETGGASRLITRSVAIRVEGYADTTTNLDDKLDTISAEVETAVANSSTIDNLLTDLKLVSTEIRFDGELSSGAGVVILEYAVIYTTAFNAPETAK
jgi:hypothetical protein